MGDDLYPNETTFFTPGQPEEQKKEDNSEKATVQEGMKLLEEIIARWTERITFYDSVNSIEVDISTHPEEHLRAVLAAKLTKQNLEQEKDYLEGLRAQYKK